MALAGCQNLVFRFVQHAITIGICNNQLFIGEVWQKSFYFFNEEEGSWETRAV